MTDARPVRLAFVVSHPIQYYAPLHRALAARPGLEVKVFFTWHGGSQEMADPGFRRSFKWDIPLTDGYAHEAVPNVSNDPGTHRFTGLRNPQLAARVLGWRPDAVHVTGYAWWSHLLAMREFHRRGIPVLFRGDSHLLDEPALGLRARVKRRLLREVYRWPSGFLCVGRANRNYYAELGVAPERIFACPHSIDVERFSADAALHEEAARQWRAELGIGADCRVLLYAGKFEDRKRSVTLMKAFGQLRLPNAVLLMVGDGPHGEEVKRIAAADPARFRLLPFQNQSRMPVVYRMGDVFVLPSAYGETWGLGVNEAMACSRPVLVSTRVGCAADLVHPDCGDLFPADDWTAFGRGLARLVEEPGRLRAMGAAALERIKPFGIGATADATVACVEEVLRGGRGPRPRFVATGFFGRPNFGDELVSRALADGLAALRPGSRVSLLTHNRATSATYCAPDAALVEGAFPSPRFFANLGAQLRALREADLLLVGGGGLVNDHYSWEAIPRFVVPACLAVLFAKPIVFVGLGVVSVRRRRLQAMARFALGQAQAVYCRDRESLERIAAWLPADLPTHVAPDLAALLAGRLATAGVGEAPLRPAAHALVNFREDPPLPLPRMVGICQGALRAHAALVLFASEIHDLGLYRRIVAALAPGERARTAIEMPRSLTHALALIRSADLVIAERLHVNLAAAFMGRPLFAIEYEGKVAAQLEPLLPASARVGIGGLDQLDTDALLRSALPAPGEAPRESERLAREALARVVEAGLSKGSVRRSAAVRLRAAGYLAELLVQGLALAAATIARRIAYALRSART